MDDAETIAKAQDGVTVRRVYGKPYEQKRGDADPGGESGRPAAATAGLGIAARPVGHM